MSIIKSIQRIFKMAIGEAKSQIFNRQGRWIWLGLLSVGLVAWGGDWANAEPFAYVAHDNYVDVTVIDTATNNVVGTVPLGGGLSYDITITPDGAYAYVAQHWPTAVKVIDTSTNTVIATVAGMDSPFGVAVTPDGSRVYVSHSGTSYISAIDTTTNVEVARVPFSGGGSHGLIVTPNGAYVYAMNNWRVQVIATATDTLVDTVLMPFNDPFSVIGGLATTPDGAYVYVTGTDGQFGVVGIIETSTHTLVETLTLPTSGLGALVFTPDGSRAYIMNFPYSIFVFDTVSKTVIDTISVPPTVSADRYKGIAITPDGNSVYVASWYNNDAISVIDTASNTLITSIPVTSDPYAIAISNSYHMDSDGDGLTDEDELAGWDITIYNCDGSVKETYHVTSDAYQADEDGDGLNDLQEKEGWHVRYRYELSPPPNPEWTWVEYDVKSNPHNADIDIDGKNDKQEKSAKTDPSRANTDCDGHWDTNDGFEIYYGLNPLDFDTDNDGLSDGLEIDLWIMVAGYSPDEPATIPADILNSAITKTSDPVIPAFIDIKPGSYPNAINLGSYGLVPVAILTSEYFDATTVNPDTVELAGAGVAIRGKGSKLMAHEEDVNGDGLVDLVVQVETENLAPESFQDGYAVLTGNLLEEFGATPIEGKDEITIVPPEE